MLNHSFGIIERLLYWRSTNRQKKERIPIKFSKSKPRNHGIYQTGVKLPYLPSASFTSPGFLNISKIPYLVYTKFPVFDVKFIYMGNRMAK